MRILKNTTIKTVRRKALSVRGNKIKCMLPMILLFLQLTNYDLRLTKIFVK